MYIRLENAMINTKYVTYVSPLTRSSKNGNKYIAFVHFVGNDYAMVEEEEYKNLLNTLEDLENE